MRDMKVAFVHYWLVNMRGGEKVLEALCELFPQADLYVPIADPNICSSRFKGHSVYTSFLQKIPGAKSHYQKLLPLFPLALEQFDLSAYDLVISSESGPAKGVLTRPETCHICYCHTPMRYLWDMYHDYRHQAGRLTRLAMPWLAKSLRQWDLATAHRVDYFVANSRHVARRIAKHYRRDAEVIHPPVDVESFSTSSQPEEFYLLVGQLVAYKRVDLAVRAFTRMQKPLVIIGDGEELDALRRVAGPTIRFMGHQPDNVVREYYSRCRAFVFPGEEDFGITPVEAQASGRPVVAFSRGGALETVREGITGTFFHEPDVDSLIGAVERLEGSFSDFDPVLIRRHSQKFAHSRFLSEMQTFIGKKVAEHRRLFCP